MVKTTRTIGPLHFEDLEPHRFEDLVRQLTYTYRSWRHLEATGRLGRDEGTDIRGVELVPGQAPAGDDADEELPSVPEEREWRIQCKRYKAIGPKLMREFVGEVVPAVTAPPYGLILAAACDASAETLAVFREETLSRGVTEAHLWTKAHLEDLLFLPQHDHLLFAYFGISLGVTMRSELQRIREFIAVKRKLMRAFDLNSVSQHLHKDILVRDVEEQRYPYHNRVAGYKAMDCPPWHVGAVEHFHVKGLLVWRYGWDGWVKPDGIWDISPGSRRPAGSLGWEIRSAWDTPAEKEAQARHHAEVTKRYEGVPQNERQHIRELWLLPYSHILEVDGVGDNAYNGPHLYCRFTGEDGPYVTPQVYYAPQHKLDPDNRRDLFKNY